jgi:hypothetical protein
MQVLAAAAVVQAITERRPQPVMVEPMGAVAAVPELIQETPVAPGAKA